MAESMAGQFSFKHHALASAELLSWYTHVGQELPALDTGFSELNEVDLVRLGSLSWLPVRTAGIDKAA